MDSERVSVKISLIADYLKELNGIKPKTFGGYKGKDKRACERLLQLLIEASVDLAALLVKELELGVPSGEEDIFARLEKSGVISKKTSGNLRQMKRFRNVLIHKYEDIDDEEVFNNIRDNLKDFDMFIREAKNFLQKK